MRIARIAEAMPFVGQLVELRGEMNRNAWTRHDSDESHLWVPLPVSMNDRADDPLDESNYEIARRLIDDVAAFGTDYRMDAWPSGVIHTLMVRIDDALALREAESIVRGLEHYSILDEEDYSQREWDHNHPSEDECYAEDCSCDAAKRR
jgi:hypothetical protein